MKKTCSLGNRDGLTLIEAIVAVVLLTFAGLAIAHAFMASSRAATAGRNLKRATQLTEMIYEQYNSYALQNFATLTLHNTTYATPKAFFNSSDDMGFGNMSVTTLAAYSTDRSSAAVTVTINWKEGSKNRQVVFTKHVTERSSLALGGTLQVWVRASDDPTSPAYPGFTVSAPAELSGASDVTGITDANGFVTLNGVRVGNDVEVTIASKMSDCSKSPTDADFKQGYYKVDGGGNPQTTQTRTMQIQEAIISTTVFSGFLPASHIVGTVQNIAPDLGEGVPVTTLEMMLTNFMGPAGEGVASYIWRPRCSSYPIQTSPGLGTYHFSNVFPNPPNMQIHLYGEIGSDPTIRRGWDSRFAWGYMGLLPPTMITVPASTDGTVQILNVDLTNVGILQAQRLGWVRMDVKDEGGLPVTDARIATSIPYLGYHPANTYAGAPYTFPVDSNGQLFLFNVFPTCNITIGMWAEAYRLPQGGDNGLYTKREWLDYPTPPDTGCLGTENVFPLVMHPGYIFNGRAIDPGGNPVPDVRLYLTMVGGRDVYSTNSDGSGYFTMTDFYPPYSGPPGSELGGLFIAQNSIPWNTYVSGTVMDSDTGQPAPNVPLVVGSIPYTPDGNAVMTSESNGSYNLTGGYSVNKFGSYGAPDCSSPPNCTGDLTLLLQAYGDLTTYSPHWQASAIGFWVYPGGSPDNTMNVRLISYRVYGTVTDSSGSPLNGVEVRDQLGASVTYTNSSGFYSLTAAVQGRSLTYNGGMNIYIPSQTIGSNSYDAWGGGADVPTVPNPSAGVQINAALTGGGGGGSM